VAIAAVAYNCLFPEERRHTLHMGVSIGVHDRRVPGLIFALKCPPWLSFRRPIDNIRSIRLALL
jgi:hypothetical protein